MSGTWFSSVQFSCSVMSDSLQPHELQHARPPCPSPTPKVYSNSCPSSRWCHPTISFSCHPLLFLPPIPPSIRVFSNEWTIHMRWPKYWIFSFKISPYNEHQHWSPLEWTGWTSSQLKGLSRVFSNTTVQKHQFFGAQLSSSSQLSHPYMTTGKTIALTRRTFVSKVMSLPLNILSRLLKIFLPRTKHLLISWLQSPSSVILEPKK